VTTVDFERLYSGDPDPWRVATDWYERRKIEVVLACLRRERYGLAWDAGCGTGDLAARLAPRCARLVATDVSPAAVQLTSARCREFAQVEAEVSALPAVPASVVGHADLVVLSEVLYYLAPQQRQECAQALVDACAPAGDVLAVHWSARPEEALDSGLDCHRELDMRMLRAGFGRLLAHRDVEFTLTMWSRDVPTTVGR